MTLLTQQQVAEQLGVSVRTVRTYKIRRVMLERVYSAWIPKTDEDYTPRVERGKEQRA